MCNTTYFDYSHKQLTGYDYSEVCTSTSSSGVPYLNPTGPNSAGVYKKRNTDQSSAVDTLVLVRDEVEDEIVNELTGKAKCVYNKMVDGNNNINWILKNFNDGNKPSEFDLVLEMSTTLSDLTNASTFKSGNTFIIKINANTLSDRTTLGLARTIIHEVSTMKVLIMIAC